MSRQLVTPIAMLTIVLLLMAGLLEIVIRQFFPVPPTWHDPQATHLESPLLGWVLPPGLDAYTIDAPVHVNSLGYRDDEILRQKRPDEYRVLGLGDSFTFALGVRFEDLWVQQLERALAALLSPSRSAQVINAGVAGYNTRQELILLDTEGWLLDPDLVVVGFYWNDLLGNDAPLPDPAVTPKQHPDSLTWERAQRDQRHLIPSFLRDRLRKSVLLYQLTTRIKTLRATLTSEPSEQGLVQRALLEGDDATLEPYLQATENRLLQIASSAAAQRVPVILMLFPMENEVRLDFPDMPLAKHLRRIWSATGMPFIDLGPAYSTALSEGRNPFLPYDLHPNAAGMQIASEHLLDAIEERGYLERPMPVVVTPAR